MSIKLPTLPVPSVSTDPDFLAMIFHGIDDPADPSNRHEYEPPEDEALACRQARVLDRLAYVLVSQAKKGVFAVGVVVMNPGSSRADSDSNTRTERSFPAIEVLVANDVIEEDTRKFLENVLESLREIRKRILESKGHHVHRRVLFSWTLPTFMKSCSSNLSCQS